MRDRYGRILWVRIFIDRMRGRTSSLSPEATGAYFRLFLAYLDRQGPLPDDDQLLASLAQASGSQWKRIRRELETHRIFQVRDGMLRDDVADERIEEFVKASERNRNNIRTRWDQSTRLEDAL